MEKEFIPYEQALALKELGFDEPCFGFYWKTDVSLGLSLSIEDKFANDNFQCNAPTFSQAFRWFREKYHIIGEVKFQGGKTTNTAWYDYVIYSEIDWNDEDLSEQWKKYEAAELACLKKLIEIVKNK